MDSRRSKKTRSYAEPSKASRTSPVSRSSASSSASGSRPGIGDRTHSAPSVAASRERQERRQTRTSSLAQQGSRAGDGGRGGNEALFSPGPADEEEESVEASNGFCLVSYRVFAASRDQFPEIWPRRFHATISADYMTAAK